MPFSNIFYLLYLQRERIFCCNVYYYFIFFACQIFRHIFQIKSEVTKLPLSRFIYHKLVKYWFSERKILQTKRMTTGFSCLHTKKFVNTLVESIVLMLDTCCILTYLLLYVDRIFAQIFLLLHSLSHSSRIDRWFGISKTFINGKVFFLAAFLFLWLIIKRTHTSYWKVFSWWFYVDIVWY